VSAKKSKRGKQTYGEGDWFAVPLKSGGFAAGLIARASKRGRVLVAYFFGPRRKVAPTLPDLEKLSPSDAEFVLKFGDFSLHSGEWPILGHQSFWNRMDWPMPTFARVDDEGNCIRVQYSEEDPSQCIGEELCSIEESRHYSEDGLFGSHLLASRLDKCL
jgi:hypothetical protein